MQETIEEKKKSTRGFASLGPKRLHEVSSRGGKNATNRHRFTPEEAAAAGELGRQARREKGERA